MRPTGSLFVRAAAPIREALARIGPAPGTERSGSTRCPWPGAPPRDVANAFQRVRRFGCRFRVLALGLEPAERYPADTRSLLTPSFAANGKMSRALCLPTLVAQEGGCRIRSPAVTARAFLEGLWDG